VLGEVIANAGVAIPDGWTPADGRLLQINQNQVLFSLLGTLYGGDGIRTFGLPDLRGRVVVGAAQDVEAGTRFGVERFLLTEAQMPAHVHALPVPEPKTWALFAAGLVLVAGAARRRALV